MATINTSQSIYHDHNVDILKAKLQDALVNVKGQIWIIPGAVFKNDSHVVSVDIIMIGYLKGYGNDKKNFSLATTIEIKHHPIESLFVKEEELCVKYSGYAASLKAQINMQNTAVVGFLNNVLTRPMYVSSIIWFDNVSKSELQYIDSTDIITADFNAEDLLNKIIHEATLSEDEIVALSELLYNSQVNI